MIWAKEVVLSFGIETINLPPRGVNVDLACPVPAGDLKVHPGFQLVGRIALIEIESEVTSMGISGQSNLEAI